MNSFDTVLTQVCDVNTAQEKQSYNVHLLLTVSSAAWRFFKI